MQSSEMMDDNSGNNTDDNIVIVHSIMEIKADTDSTM